MSIEIITHCYAKKYPHFADCLQAQLASIRYNCPKCGVKVTVCCVEEDRKTIDIVHEEDEWISPFYLPTVKDLGRRAIGRNRAALFSTADIVWFADVDHLFINGVLDRLHELQWPENTTMIYPQEIMISKDHETGNQQLAKIGRGWELFFDQNDFVQKHYYKAIGGVQVVRGGFVRKYGYLNNTKWMTCFNKTPFGDFRDDMAFRQFCLKHGEIQGIDLPGVFRLRHLTTSYQ